MRGVGGTALLLLVFVTRTAGAQKLDLDRVVLETSSTEARAPGLVGISLLFEDRDGRTIHWSRLPQDSSVLITRDGAPLYVELEPGATGGGLEGELRLRTSGIYRLQARIERAGARLVESEVVTVTATSSVDFGVIRSGETVCRPLPGGGRGLLGHVVDGGSKLPSGLHIWGGCLVADDTVVGNEGTVRAEVAVLVGSGNGRDVERRYYDISYRVQPRFVTPRRLFLGFCMTALLGLVVAVSIAVRSPRRGFGPGTAFAWASVEKTPYRGERAPQWNVVELEPDGRNKGPLDLSELVGPENLEPGVLRVRPVVDGFVEVVGPRTEEIRAIAPNGAISVARHKLIAAFGSTLSFRNITIAILVGDNAIAAVNGATDFLCLPRS